jgi:hypothetical protein
MVIDLVIVTAPNPPGSRQLISPPAAVFEIAPAKVLQGAVRLQGLTSSPTPETHVRVACAEAGVARQVITKATKIEDIMYTILLIFLPLNGEQMIICKETVQI